MTYREFWRKLTDIYGEREAKDIARLVYEERFGLNMTDICMGEDGRMADGENKTAGDILERLLKNEPVQYVLGSTYFGQSQYLVKLGVLIPRPETAALVKWMCEEEKREERGERSGERKERREECLLMNRKLGKDGQATTPLPPVKKLLDCCCGSGCIALEMKREFPEMLVSAYDISDTALEVSRENARRLGRDIDIFKMDALNPEPVTGKYDIIVSNPPYVCEHEKADMRQNVLTYEPATALFVPDNDPLRFYSAIAHHARQALKDGGRLYFEINPLFVREMKAMLGELGFRSITVNNSYGYTDRMMKATKQL